MLLSKSCEYGLRATLFLASTERDDYISISEISEKLDISFHFLTKILQKLNTQGLLESFKGPNGGVKLAKPSDQIQLLEIVETIDGDELFNECVLGLPGCGDKEPCALHNKWMDQRENIKTMFKSTDLKTLAEESMEKDYRINLEQTFKEL